MLQAMTAALAPLFSIEGKVAVVTGGSRGVGRMIAGGFVDAGARVYISSRRADACNEVAAELSARGTCVAIPADLSTPDGTGALAAAVVAREPAVDVLVNNAGTMWTAPLQEYPDAAFDKLWAINVKALFRLTTLLLPQLRAAARPGDPARVINVGSVDGGRVPDWESYAYSASKAGVHMLTRHLAVRLAPEQVAVNAIVPGPFESKITRTVFDDDEQLADLIGRVPLGRVGTPDDMVGVSIFLASRAAAYLTGALVPVDGGMSAR